MSREQYFATSPMDWFREGQDSRYSPYHWEEMNYQARYTASKILDGCTGQNLAVGMVGFGFGRDTKIFLDEFEREETGRSLHIVGLDINKSRFGEATDKLGIRRYTEYVRPLAASMNHIPITSDSFDATVCQQTMVHADDPRETLSELVRVTKPGGLVIFNMSTSHGRVHDALLMVVNEGLRRSVMRVSERRLRTRDKSSKRSTLYTHRQLMHLVTSRTDAVLVEHKTFSRGITTFFVLRKSCLVK